MGKKSNKNSKKAKRLFFTLIALIVFTASAGQIDLAQVDWDDPASIVAIFSTNEKNQLENYDKLSSLPAYSGDSVVSLNENQPFFSEEDLSLTKKNWQSFSNLDQFNRVGAANAMLHKDMMPQKKREDISQVYPTGWKQKKIKEDVWLYNRSHLIGHQFTGEDVNWKNLFTGTQQMNQGPMKEYEEKIAAYLKETGHHVRYRVTPYFKDNELVARGVELEAQSIEDDRIQLNIFIYNVQNGYQINYLDGSSKKSS